MHPFSPEQITPFSPSLEAKKDSTRYAKSKKLDVVLSKTLAKEAK